MCMKLWSSTCNFKLRAKIQHRNPYGDLKSSVPIFMLQKSIFKLNNPKVTANSFQHTYYKFVHALLFS